MTTGTPFAPAPFATSYVSPTVASAFRRSSYITPSEYRFTPTAVSTRQLVVKSANPQVDSVASLAVLIEQASAWADLIAFHRSDGSFAASVTTEMDWVKVKPDGSLALICNFKPVLEVTGLALGPQPAQVSNADASTAQNLWVQGKVINIPAAWASSPIPAYSYPSGPNGGVYAVWTYVNGYANTLLAQNAVQGATSITLQPSVPGGSSLSGIYTGTQLEIYDGSNKETVVAASTPTGTTVTLTAGLQYPHNVPVAPDGIRVSAIPPPISRATVHLTSVLVKTRGTRAMQMAGAAGGSPGKQAIAEAGAENDFEYACKLLKRYETVYLHS